MGAWRSLVLFHLVALFTIVYGDDCSLKISRQKYYSNAIQSVRVENRFGDVFFRKHREDSEARILASVNLVGTLQHAANPPIVFTDNGRGKALVKVGPLAGDNSSVKLSLLSSWMLSLPVMAALLFQGRSFVIATLILFSIWISVTLAENSCPSGDVEVLVPRNSCFSVANNQNGRTLDIHECELENRPQVVACSVSGYLYPNCTGGSRGIRLSWDIMLSAATNDSLSMADSPVLIEWNLRAVNCPTCSGASSFAAILELHEVSDIRNFQSWNKMLPSDDLPLVNGSVVTFSVRIDTPMEGYSISRECVVPGGSTVFTNVIPFNPGPLAGELSFNMSVFNAHQSAVVMAASEVCFLLRGFENGICGVLTYRASLGTMVCRNDSINFTTLSYSYQEAPDNTVRACLQNDEDLDVGRYFVVIEATDYVGLSTVICPDVNFVVDNMPPQFIDASVDCFTGSNGSIPRISWDIQALSGIVAIRYNISNIDLGDPQDFLQFPTPVEPVQSGYNLQSILQGRSGTVYLTLQAESGVGLTTTNTIPVASNSCSSK